MRLEKKDFLTLQELDYEMLEEFVEHIIDSKKKEPNISVLAQKTIVNLLLTPDLHTRILMETVVQQLGAKSILVDFVADKWKLIWQEDAMNLASDEEHVKDIAKLFSAYGNSLAVQHVPYTGNWRLDRQDSIIKGFAKHSLLPVINLESTLFNPCQALADIVTVKEALKTVGGCKAVLAWTHNPGIHNMSTANSFALAASKSGMDLTIASPPKYGLDPGIMKLVDKNLTHTRASLQKCNDLKTAMRGAHIVYAVNWRSLEHYDKPEEEKTYQQQFADWSINADLMETTDGAYLMHPFPVKRNVGIAKEVLDSNNSLIYKQVENKLQAQKMLLASLLS